MQCCCPFQDKLQRLGQYRYSSNFSLKTHDLLRVAGPTLTQYGIYPKMRASDYFDVFKQAGVVLFSKEVANSAWGEGMCVEWSNLKLHADFFGNSIARTINYTERY
jgi:hypothetical protein